MDVHTPQQRSRNMAAIKAKDTGPEMEVRRMLHRRGFRYALHKRGLPGRPDLVFASRRKVVFVHGCYWHMHDCRYGRVAATTRAEFWRTKRLGNVERDRRNVTLLEEAGWDVFVVWECEIKDGPALQQRLVEFLGQGCTRSTK